MKHILLHLLLFLTSVLLYSAEVSLSVLDSIPSEVEIDYVSIDTVDVDSVDIVFVNASEHWDKLLMGMQPSINYVKAIDECLGDNKEYVPDTMTYIGYKWEELLKKQSAEGLTKEISDAWVKLLKELKPYIH